MMQVELQFLKFSRKLINVLHFGKQKFLVKKLGKLLARILKKYVTTKLESMFSMSSGLAAKHKGGGGGGRLVISLTL